MVWGSATAGPSLVSRDPRLTPHVIPRNVARMQSRATGEKQRTPRWRTLPGHRRARPRNDRGKSAGSGFESLTAHHLCRSDGVSLSLHRHQQGLPTENALSTPGRPLTLGYRDPTPSRRDWPGVRSAALHRHPGAARHAALVQFTPAMPWHSGTGTARRSHSADRTDLSDHLAPLRNSLHRHTVARSTAGFSGADPAPCGTVAGGLGGTSEGQPTAPRRGRRPGRRRPRARRCHPRRPDHRGREARPL